MIDRKHIGLKLGSHSVEVEKGRLRFFAKVTGQLDPIYIDEDAATVAGYPSIPAPPTFVFTLDLDQDDPFELYRILDVDLERILHGEQAFSYHAPVYAGDTLRFESTVTDIYDKKNGALEFIVQDTTATNQHGVHVANMRRTVVVRNS